MTQVPAIVLLKTIVILTISSRRQEKTVGIKSSCFKCHYYELSSRSKIMDNYQFQNSFQTTNENRNPWGSPWWAHSVRNMVHLIRHKIVCGSPAQICKQCTLKTCCVWRTIIIKPRPDGASVINRHLSWLLICAQKKYCSAQQWGSEGGGLELWQSTPNLSSFQLLFIWLIKGNLI